MSSEIHCHQMLLVFKTVDSERLDFHFSIRKLYYQVAKVGFLAFKKKPKKIHPQSTFFF